MFGKWGLSHSINKKVIYNAVSKTSLATPGWPNIRYLVNLIGEKYCFIDNIISFQVYYIFLHKYAYFTKVSNIWQVLCILPQCFSIQGYYVPMQAHIHESIWMKTLPTCHCMGIQFYFILFPSWNKQGSTYS